jgi:hypothetical protein
MPARAHSGLAARISNPGLASRIDVHPEADCFNDPPGNFAGDVPKPDMSIPQVGEATGTGAPMRLYGTK